MLLPEYESKATNSIENKSKIFLLLIIYLNQWVSLFCIYPQLFNTITPPMKVALNSHFSELVFKTPFQFTRRTISLVAFKVSNFTFFPITKLLSVRETSSQLHGIPRYSNAKWFAQVVVPKFGGIMGSRVSISNTQSSLINHLSFSSVI